MTQVTGDGEATSPLPGGDDVSSLSFEEARDALVAVVQALEGGGTTLEQSLALWERGEALADHCQQWLDGARRRIEEVRRARVTPPDEE